MEFYNSFQRTPRPKTFCDDCEDAVYEFDSVSGELIKTGMTDIVEPIQELAQGVDVYSLIDKYQNGALVPINPNVVVSDDIFDITDIPDNIHDLAHLAEKSREVYDKCISALNSKKAEVSEDPKKSEVVDNA